MTVYIVIGLASAFTALVVGFLLALDGTFPDEE